MSPVKLDVVTAERLVYSDEVDILVAPGIDGELGILPYHVPLMTILKAGEMRARKGNDDPGSASGNPDPHPPRNRKNPRQNHQPGKRPPVRKRQQRHWGRIPRTSPAQLVPRVHGNRVTR